MNDPGWAPKQVIPPTHCVVEILSSDTTETYGPQIAVKVKVVGGEHDGYVFTDYSNRDENTGQVKQGGKAWSIFEACLGKDFHKRYPSVNAALKALVGRRFMAQVSQTKTASRNKLEFGTVSPVPEDRDVA